MNPIERLRYIRINSIHFKTIIQTFMDKLDEVDKPLKKPC